jgi:hypothetical protein
MYERIMRENSCYQVTYGPSFVLIHALTGLAWDADRYTHTYTVPNEELRPADEWRAHQQQTEH